MGTPARLSFALNHSGRSVPKLRCFVAVNSALIYVLTLCQLKN